MFKIIIIATEEHEDFLPNNFWDGGLTPADSPRSIGIALPPPPSNF